MGFREVDDWDGSEAGGGHGAVGVDAVKDAQI